MKWTDTGKTEKLWENGPLVNNAYMQYFYSPWSILMNHITPEMKGAIAPTDSRLRSDIRTYENGEIDKSEDEKNKIEGRQR